MGLKRRQREFLAVAAIALAAGVTGCREAGSGQAVDPSPFLELELAPSDAGPSLEQTG